MSILFSPHLNPVSAVVTNVLLAKMCPRKKTKTYIVHNPIWPQSTSLYLCSKLWTLRNVFFFYSWSDEPLLFFRTLIWIWTAVRDSGCRKNIWLPILFQKHITQKKTSNSAENVCFGSTEYVSDHLSNGFPRVLSRSSSSTLRDSHVHH